MRCLPPEAVLRAADERHLYCTPVSCRLGRRLSRGSSPPSGRLFDTEIECIERSPDPTAPRRPSSDSERRSPIARSSSSSRPASSSRTRAAQVQGTNLRAKAMLGRAARARPAALLRPLRLPPRRARRWPTTASPSSRSRHEGPLPELRVDLPGPRRRRPAPCGSPGSPYGGAEPAVVLQVRPGVAGDRRRRTEPHWMGGPQLRIFTLGRSRVESGEGPLAGEWLGHKPGPRPQVPRHATASGSSRPTS